MTALNHGVTQYLILLPPPIRNHCRNIEEGALAGSDVLYKEEYKR